MMFRKGEPTGRVRVKAGATPCNDRPVRPVVAYTLRVTAVTVSALLLTAVGAVAASPVEEWMAVPLL